MFLVRMKWFLVAAAATTTVCVTDATAADATGAAVGGIRGSSGEHSKAILLSISMRGEILCFQ